jgi:hypothetical protein
MGSQSDVVEYIYCFRLETSYFGTMASIRNISIDGYIFNGIRMRGGSEGRMAIARLDKVGLLLFSLVCFAFKNVAPC